MINTEEAIGKLKSKTLDYWEEAEAIRDILDSGMTQHSLALTLGCTQATISNKVRLLKLPEEVKADMKEKGILGRTARSLLRINNTKQQIEVIEHVYQFNLDTNAADAYINKLVDSYQGSRSIKEFASIVSQGIKGLKANGINVGSTRVDREGCTDLIIRFYKKQEVEL